MILDFSKVTSGKEVILEVGGSKNTAQPLLFLACGLAYKHKKKVFLDNFPNLLDSEVSIKLLNRIGIVCRFDEANKLLMIDGGKSNLKNAIPYDLYKKIRYSILLMGILLTFYSELKIFLNTGGCIIDGVRKNDIHYDFFKVAGFNIEELGDFILLKKFGKEVTEIDFTLNIKSTSVSANILIYLLLNHEKLEKIRIKNFYGDRPDIQELIKFSELFGFNVFYSKGELGKIQYSKISNKDINYSIVTDFDQLHFLIFLGLISKNKFIINNYNNKYKYQELELIDSLFPDLISIFDNKIIINLINTNLLEKHINVFADAYPKIMSDSQPILSILALFVKHITIFDNRFRNRYGYKDYYKDFGFNFNLSYQGLHLYNNNDGSKSKNLDYELYSIRESGLLILLGIYTKSCLKITNKEILLRGYEGIFRLLRTIGVGIS